MGEEIILKETQYSIREKAVKISDNKVKIIEEINKNGKWEITKTRHIDLDQCHEIAKKWEKEVVVK
jgi:hypothetical protein